MYNKEKLMTYINNKYEIYHSILTIEDFNNYNVILCEYDEFDSIEFQTEIGCYYIHIKKSEYLKYLRINKLKKLWI